MSKSRLEKFLYALYSLDSSDLPNPLSRIEELYKCLVTGEEAPTFKPLSRVEKYLMAILGGYEVELLPNPLSRVEALLYKLATGDDNLEDFDTFLSEHEELLAEIIRNGGVGGDIDIEYVLYTLSTEFNTLYNTAEKPVKSAILKGATQYRDVLTNIVFETCKEAVEVWSTNAYQLRDSQDSGTPGSIGSGTDVITLDFCGVIHSSYILTGNCMYKKVVFYNNNYEYIKGYRTGETTDDLIINEIPENACYVRFSFFPYDDNSGTCSVVDGNYNPINLREIELVSVKMPVLKTTGKNLFDVNLETKNKTIDLNTGVANVDANDRNTSDYIRVFTGDYIANNVMTRIAFYDKNKKFISVETSKKTFTVSDDICYIRFSYNNYETNIQLEKGSLVTPYKPFKSNILTVNEEVELRGVGDVQDELNLLTGELTERLITKTYDGSENWLIAYGNTDEKLIFFRMDDGDFKHGPSIVTTNNLVREYRNPYAEPIYNTMGIIFSSIRIRLGPEINTLELFKDYLSKNNLIITAECSQKPIKTVDLSVVDQDGNDTKLKTFNDITHVTLFSEGLIPEAELEVATKNEEDLEDSIVYTTHTLSEEFNTLYNTAEKPVKSAILKGNTSYNEEYIQEQELISVKMPVLTTTGKNLFNGELENGAIVSSTGVNTPSTDNVRSVGYIKVKPNTSIVLSNDLKYSNNTIYEYDSNKDYIGRKNTNPFTTSTNCHYIRFRSDSNQPNLDVKYQIEYGTIATPYEPFKSNILTVNEDVELRGMGDVQDTLDCLTGEYIQRVGQEVLNTSNPNIKNIKTAYHNNTANLCAFDIEFKLGHHKNAIPISDKLAPQTNTQTLPSIIQYKEHVFVVRVPFKDDGTNPTLEEFKVWLDEIVPTVYYELLTESIKTVDLSVVDQDGNDTKLSTFNDITHVTLSSEGLIPEAELEVAEKVPEVAANMLGISREQEVINTATNEQSENVDATMIATTEIYEGLL